MGLGRPAAAPLGVCVAFPASIGRSNLDLITDSRRGGASGFRLADAAAVTCASVIAFASAPNSTDSFTASIA